MIRLAERVCSIVKYNGIIFEYYIAKIEFRLLLRM